jgi:hypothetical protein
MRRFRKRHLLWLPQSIVLAGIFSDLDGCLAFAIRFRRAPYWQVSHLRELGF